MLKDWFSRGRSLLVSLALIAIVVIVYAPVRHYEFINYDDPDYVGANPNVVPGLASSGVLWAFTTGQAANWHPLTWLSHMLDVRIYGLNPGAHHLTNVLFHIANTLLLFWLLYRMTGGIGRSAFVAALFAAHPLHVESVAWVSERKDVLSTFFWMLTILAYVEYVRQPRFRRYVLMFVCFALGLMAKPMLVTLPFLLLLLDFWPLRRLTGLNLVLEKLPLLALSAGSSIITFIVQKQAGGVAKLDVLTMNERVTNALVSYLAYIGKMLWPTRLAAFYPYAPQTTVWWAFAAAVILIGLSVLTIRAARRYPYLPVGWFWYLGTLVPVIGLVQVGTQSMADRFTYVPLIGLFIIAAWGVPDLLARMRYRHIAMPVAAGLVISLCMIAARSQVEYWKNSQTLWEHALEATSNNCIAHFNLGLALAGEGKTDQAILHYSEAVRLKPTFAEAHYNLGLALAHEGRSNEAFDHYSEALRLQFSF